MHTHWKTTVTPGLCWRAELVVFVHCCRGNKLQRARKALIGLHSTPRNITWPLTLRSDLQPDYFTCSSPSFNPEVPITFSFTSLLSFSLSCHLFHSTSMSHLHYLNAISQCRSIVLCDCIVHPSISSPLSQSLYCKWDEHCTLFQHIIFISSSSSFSRSFLQSDFCLTFISLPPLFLPIGPERRLFCWPRALALALSLLSKKKKPWTQTSVSELLNPFISMSRLINLNLQCYMQIWKKTSLEFRS